MGKGTGRKNKSTSEPTQTQQTAFQQPSSLTILSEPNGQWSWIIEHGGKAYIAGTPPASGPARFNVLNHAADSVVLNYTALLQMAQDRRRLEGAKRSLQPSPG